MIRNPDHIITYCPTVELIHRVRRLLAYGGADDVFGLVGSVSSQGLYVYTHEDVSLAYHAAKLLLKDVA